MHTNSPPSYRKPETFQHLLGWVQPYIALARLDRPTGIWLLWLPCCWGVALAGASAWMYGLFLVGAAVMRGAGCTINDMMDRRFDRHVARTACRPLAAGTVSMGRALIFLGLQLSLGLGVLLLLSQEVWLLGIVGLGLAAVYPLMKRWTHWAQLFLGFTFNWGVLMGYGGVSVNCLLLYGAGICWTLIYDTVYAYQDVEDDRRLGLKSLALLLGPHPKWVLLGFASVMAALVMSVTKGWILVALLFGEYGYKLWRLDVADSAQCFRFFSKVSVGLGVGLWVLLMMEGVR